MYTLKNVVDYNKFVKIPGASYEPEIFHALCIRTKGLYFIVYKSGKVVITGIKNQSMISNIINQFF